MQTLPASTKLRNFWDDAIEDGHICERERAQLSTLIALVDDGVHHAMTVLKAGPRTRRARKQREEFEGLHGPINLDEYQDEKTRRHCSNSDDAA